MDLDRELERWPESILGIKHAEKIAYIAKAWFDSGKDNSSRTVSQKSLCGLSIEETKLFYKTIVGLGFCYTKPAD